MKDLKNVEKGYLGSLIVEKSFVRKGFNVFKPSMENGKVDMIVEKDNIYLKIQIKIISNSKDRSKSIPVRKLSHNKTSHKTYLYTKEDIDYFIGVDIDTEDLYILPIEFSSTYKSAITVTAADKYKNNFNLKELYSGNTINGGDNIGKLLTDNADDNTEA